MRQRIIGRVGGVALLLLLAGMAGPARAQAADDSHYFPETRHTVSGTFWTYWQTHGGLAQQGYPITEEFQETSPIDGKPYTVQYFERGIFELHPEKAPPYTVLLTPLGRLALQKRYPTGSPPGQVGNPAAPRRFPQTGHTIGGAFAAYWDGHGGLAQYGYPLTEEFRETSPTDGKPYTVQYFERAIFESHPDAPAGFKVQLGLLGRLQYHDRYEAVVHPRPPQWPPAPGLPPPLHPLLLNATFATPDLSAWHTLPNGVDEPAWTVLNAHLQQAGDSSGQDGVNDAVYLTGSPDWSNYILEAQVYITSGDPVGLVWRAQGTRYYRFEMLQALPNTHWKAALDLVDGNNVTSLATVPADRFAGYQPEHWSTIQVVTLDARQQVRVDGVSIIDIQDSTLTDGQVGLYAVDSGATAFDNVRVQQLGR